MRRWCVHVHALLDIKNLVALTDLVTTALYVVHVRISVQMAGDNCRLFGRCFSGTDKSLTIKSCSTKGTGRISATHRVAWHTAIPRFKLRPDLGQRLSKSSESNQEEKKQEIQQHSPCCHDNRRQRRSKLLYKFSGGRFARTVIHQRRVQVVDSNLPNFEKSQDGLFGKSP